MTFLSKVISAVFGLLGGGLAFGPAALAQEAYGGPEPWQLGLQPAVTPTMERITSFHDLLLWVITLITLFVLALLLYVMWRFSEHRNPNPSSTTHNTLIEVLWTVIPVVILVAIAVPSFRLLYFADRIEDADLTVKAIGKQWYWSYAYPDHGNFEFDSYMIPDADLKPGEPRLLAADNAMVLPVDTNIRFLITAADVLHNFAVPAFGLKLDGVPGRINETWAYIPPEYAGQTFYGQCSELCGTNHAYMPIMIKMVSKADFDKWVKEAQEEYASDDRPSSEAVEADLADLRENQDNPVKPIGVAALPAQTNAAAQ